jgi:tetratricopeptide (TPR) repeat protein
LINPWDAHFNADVGEAAVHLGYQEIAVFSYEKAVESDPKNKDYLRALAYAYEKRVRYPEAIRIWERVQQLDPLDTEARSKITGLNATDMIKRANFEEAPKLKDVVKQGYEESVKGGVEQDSAAAPGESAEDDLRHAIRRDPAAIGNYLKLAELYRKELRYDEAMDMYQKALQVAGGDPNVRERLEDVQLEMGRRNRDFLKQDAANHPDDAELQQRLVEVKRELLLQEISVFSTRAERYPQDLRLKAELGQRFVESGKPDKAIPLFQQAAKDPRLEAVVLVSLGRCFLKVKKNDLAEFQFKRAVTKLNASDHKSSLLDCHFWLGRLAEQAGRNDDAITHFNEVISLDYGYKDARERLEKLQGDRGQEGGLSEEV